jgi:putative spermidine/putrescine transport system permease protein
MALPSYASPVQRTYYYFYLFFCTVVFFFLIAPLFAIIPISFSVSPFMVFTEGMLAWPPDPEAWSIRWYRNMIGDCSADVVSSTVPCSTKWMKGTVNSFYIGIIATVIATALGTLAALGLSRPHMPYKGLIMAILISPMIVPLIISGVAIFFFMAKVGLAATHLGIILAHIILGTPFVVITVTATLSGFDHSITRAASSLGSSPYNTFMKITLPLILPGVISGGLFAFVTSFDEVVVVLFLAGLDNTTIPIQMWTGLREQLSPTILAVATCLIVLSVLILLTAELLRRRSERLRGINR